MRDDDLIQRAQAGDQTAVAALLKRQEPFLRRVLQDRIPGRHAAKLGVDDILQTTFLAAVLNLSTYNPSEGAFESWIARIANNDLIEAIRGLDALKRGGKIGHVTSGGADGEDFIEQLVGLMTSPTKKVARAEFMECVTAALESLPEVYQQVFRWRHVENASVEAIAGRMGRSEGAVFMLLRRAQEALRERLGSASRFSIV